MFGISGRATFMLEVYLVEAILSVLVSIAVLYGIYYLVKRARRK